MTIRKSNPYLSLVNSYLIDSPQPSSINYWWNVGSLLGLCLVIQIASGIFLAMHYSSSIELAFNSVEHIMRDVNAGWLIRYIHANGASFFFICLYLHIGKALYYGSYKSPRVLVWSIGVIIFILTIATAFMGYNYNSSPKSFYNALSKGKGITRNAGYYKSNSHAMRGYISPSVNNIYMSNNFYKRNFSMSCLCQEKLGYAGIKINPKKDITDANLIFKELNIYPEKWWEDLDKPEVRSSLYKEVKNKSGIYIIINKITRNTYIGSGSTNRLHARFSNHLLNFHGSKLIKKSVQKYGLNNFIFAILEYYPYEMPTSGGYPRCAVINKENNKELLALETSYISLIVPQYNILTEAGNSFGYKHSEENLLKMKLAFTEERKELLRQLQYKRKGLCSQESKDKLREISLNRPLDYFSKETRMKISNKCPRNAWGYRTKGAAFSLNIILNSIDNKYFCEIKGINKTSNLLCCSYKTIQCALDLGWIYVPDSFIPLLNDLHIKSNNDIITHININNNITNLKGNKKKLKSTLVNLIGHTKILINKK